MSVQISGFLILMALVAVVVAVPVLDNNDPTQDEKYAKDSSATRPVLSYILGAAGCLIILGVLYFAFCKYKRGERVLGMQKKQPANRARDADVELRGIVAADLSTSGHQFASEYLYDTTSSYGRAGQAAPETVGQAYVGPDFNKPLPRHSSYGQAFCTECAALKPYPGGLTGHGGYFSAAPKEARNHGYL